MQVEYELTPEDLKAFQRYHQKHPLVQPSKLAKLLPILIGVVLGLAFVAFFSTRPLLYSALLYAPSLYELAAMAPGVPVGVVLTLFGFSLYLRLIQSNATRKALQEGRNAEKTLGWRRVSIDPHTIRTRTPFSSGAFFWEGVDAVVASKDHVFFYITTRLAYVVPRRAFPDDRTFDDFVETARRYFQISRLGDGRRESIDEDGEWDNPGPPVVAPSAKPARSAGEGIVAKTRPPEEAKPQPKSEHGNVS